MLLSSVPPVAASLITTTDCVLQAAPVSKGWRADAPRNVVFLSPALTRQALLIQIALLRPTTIIVGDQPIDADVLEQWRTSHPFGNLCLIRRGTSLDKIRLDLCESHAIQVLNTPGVNAPHVAAYILRWLRLADGSIPRDVRVLGYGNVGKELVNLLLDRDPNVRIRVLVRPGRASDTLGNPASDSRVSFVVDWFEALEGAAAVAVCVSLNDESVHRLDRALIQCLHRQARLICVAKPDVFSDGALYALAEAEHIQLVLDYGPATLDEFRQRTQRLGCEVSTWYRPATLTTQASTTEACHRDLDYAVSIQLSLMALRGLVRRKLAQSLTLPSLPAAASAPRVSIIGRGINGLFQAVMLRLANYQVTVYGGDQKSDGVSYADPYLAVECNRAGIELFDKFLADNPTLAKFAQARDVEVSSYGLELIHLKKEIKALLGSSGVRFPSQPLSPVQIAAQSREHFIVIACEEEGVSIVYCCAHHHIAAGGTYAAGTTQGLLWASLVQEIIQANQNLAVE
ncbi:NAD(P)-dependent oxidoreductase [Pseudomonas sp. NFPP28]|uniref:NAD(P)-dependent oxidoreductase n=1 Tax=Pseudomonas sp. NFPP28 TaxID=1566231 RepID=UPI0008E1605C|nr:NAD(P)-dependent oxidoreductase [Pseudomonas sp. NFPP28]SFP59830.1 Lactate dehydrogenase [Pseudomonas sp. NFPP28]